MYIVFLCLIIEPIPQYDDCKPVVRQWFSLQEPGKPPAGKPPTNRGKPPAGKPPGNRQIPAGNLPVNCQWPARKLLETCWKPAGNLPKSRWEPAVTNFQHKDQIKGITSQSFQLTKLFLQFLIYLRTYIAQTYLQPHYGNGFFGNVYNIVLSSWKVNIAKTPLP